MAPRRWRSHISRAPLGFCGQKPRLASALVGGLLANFVACSSLLVAGGWVRASASHKRPHTKKFLQVKQSVFIDVFVRFAATTLKKSHGRGNAEPLAYVASKPAGKIFEVA